MMGPRLQWTLAALLGGYALVSLSVGARHALASGQSQDLAPIYMAARLWLHGEDPYRAHTADDWRLATPTGGVPTDAIERAYSTPYAPVAVLVVSGIAALEWETAKACWLAVNLALAGYIAWLLSQICLRGMPAPAAAMLIAVWFGGIGLRVGLGNGQHTLVWFAAVLTMYWLMTRHRSWWAGVALALSLHKYPLTVFVLPFLAAHGWFRLLAAAALATIAALAVFTLGLGVPAGQVLESFLRESAWWYGQTGDRSLQAQGVTDFRPVLAALFSEGPAVPAMYSVTAIAFTAVCWPVLESRAVPRAIDLQAVFLLMLFATYHRVYDTVVLVLPLWGLALSWDRVAGWRGGAMRVLVVLMALVWYADPTAIYRRIAPMALDAPPDTGLFLAMDLGFRMVIAAALVVVVVKRFAAPRPMTLVLGSVPS